MTSQDSDDPKTELLQRLQEGDPEAWSKFYNNFAELLFQWIRNQVGSALDAEDVLGEVCLALPREIQNFDGEKPLITFVYSVASRKVTDYWRAQKDRELQPLKIVDGLGTGPELQAALRQLTEMEQNALQLRYLEGLSVEEIAAALGRTRKATESLLKRAHNRLTSGFGRTDQGDYGIGVLASRYPKMQGGLLPTSVDIYEQQQKCEAAGHHAEARIFQQSVSKLALATQMQAVVEMETEDRKQPSR